MKAGVVWDRLLDVLYPPDVACFACDQQAHVDENGLCAACAARIHPAGVLDPPPGLSGLYAGLVYCEALHAPMHRFKYGNARYLARSFAACMRLPAQWTIDFILPVPLYAGRQKTRGYNQSMLLARVLAKRYDVPIEESLLTRIVDTCSQAQLPAHMRASNVRGAFRASPAAHGRTLLLVDDVVTTGSTLSACAATLKDAGAARVYAACACAAPLTHAQSQARD